LILGKGPGGPCSGWQRLSAESSPERAPALAFFAAPVDSSYITGEILTLLGGATRAA
jgi:hypothetical protein